MSKNKKYFSKLSSKKILISVGGKPKKLDIPGTDLAWSSDDIFELKDFPKKLLIIGGGYIACEFASIFKNLGTEVTQLIRGKKLLNGFDKDLSECLEKSMTSLGINLKFQHQLKSIRKINGDLESTLESGSKLLSNNILVATGREPALKGLRLDILNLKMDGI